MCHAALSVAHKRRWRCKWCCFLMFLLAYAIEPTRCGAAVLFIQNIAEKENNKLRQLKPSLSHRTHFSIGTSITVALAQESCMFRKYGWHGTQMSWFSTHLDSGVTVRYNFGTTGKKLIYARFLFIYFEQTVVQIKKKNPLRCENTNY